MSDKRQMDLTQGGVGKQLFSFMMPFLLSNVLQALYNVVDMLIVGNYSGPSAISAVNIGGQVMMVIASLIIGITIGGTVLVAQFKGAGHTEDTKKTVATMLSLAVFIGVAMSLLSMVVAKPLLRLVNTPEEAFDGAVDYLRVCGMGTIFIFCYNGISSILRGLGDSRRPLYFILFSTCTNIVLDLLLVGRYGMGPFGAAIATVISQALAVVIAVIYLRKTGFMFDFHPSSFRIDKKIAARILRIGLPSSVQMTLVSSSHLFITSLVNDFSVVASAASGIGAKIDSFATMPSLAISSAISSMSGQNIGAGKYDRVRKIMKYGIALSLAIAALIFVLCQIFPEAFFRAFLEDPSAVDAAAVIELGRLYLSIVPYSYFLLSLLFSFNGLSTGSGNTMFTLLNSVLNTVVIRVPMAYLLAYGLDMGLKGVYLGMAISPIGGVIAGLLFYLSGRWRRSRVVPAAGEPEPTELTE